VAPPPRKPLLAELKPPEPPKHEEVKLPPVIEKEKPLPLAKNAPLPELNISKPLPPKPEIRTNVFSSGSSEHAVKLPAREVQTGGFGDPNGVRGDGKPEKQVNVASLGSFDLPVGDGAGSGTGGARGTRGVVASAGFGSGVSPVTAGSGSGRTVSQGSFGDVEVAPSAAGPRKKDTGPPQTQAEILYKPRPDYTDEARKIKLEGEVLLRVLFTSTGEVQVLNVVRGLGHGLDESAVRAAQQIRFKPARRDGQPVDSTANVYIVFQLAY
jgi:TonB family protein